jgi:hypothetical protein
MSSLKPDVEVTRQAISRLVGSLTDDPKEQATIAAEAAFAFIEHTQGTLMAQVAFSLAATLPTTRSGQ